MIPVAAGDAQEVGSEDRAGGCWLLLSAYQR